MKYNGLILISVISIGLFASESGNHRIVLGMPAQDSSYNEANGEYNPLSTPGDSGSPPVMNEHPPGPAPLPLRLASIYLDTTEDTCVKKAVADLKKDIFEITHVEVRQVSTIDEIRDNCIIVGTLGTSEALTTLFGQPSTLPIQEGDWERFTIKTVTIPSKGVCLVIAGSDKRGTMYGVYSLSEEYLGTDPFRFWTGYTPPFSLEKTIPAIDGYTVASPTFNYRGWFINDEELLKGMSAASPWVELELYDAIFETMVRCKNNIGVPTTWPLNNYKVSTSEAIYNPDTDERERRARDRGLIIAQHHAIPVGSCPAREWYPGVDYSIEKKGTNGDGSDDLIVKFREFWRWAINRYQEHDNNIVVLWDLSFRGKDDKPYWYDDPIYSGSDWTYTDAHGVVQSKRYAYDGPNCISCLSNAQKNRVADVICWAINEQQSFSRLLH